MQTSESSLESIIEQCKRSGKPQAAIEAIEVALLDDPGNGRLHWRLGEVYRETKRLREAKEVFERAVPIWPAMPEIRASLGLVCQEMKLIDEAIGHFEEAVTLRPDNASDWNNLGILFSDKRAFDRAIECYRKAIAVDPNYAFAWNNLGNAAGYTGRYDESLAAFDEAIRLKPDYAEAYNNRAVTRTQLEDHDAALDDYARALHFRPEYSEAHTNRSLLLLLLAQFRAGWTEYEWRWRGKDLTDRKYNAQRWNGGPLAGKRILLYAEQGLGDTLNFVRYARELKARGATVYVECPRPLCKLLSRSPGIDRLFHRGQELPPFDYYAPMLAVPGLVGTSLKSMPSAAPYVFPHPELTRKWADRLARYRGTFNIGMVWQGNPQHRGDRKRSIPLKLFAPLAAVPGVRLFSLQKGFGVEQIATAAQEVSLLDLGNVGVTEDGFLRTAAILKNMDLVVAADTSVAHLAGAMGVPVWVAMSTACDWRWMLNREDTPWYPSMRLFRQRGAGEWDDVFGRIVDAVKPLVMARLARVVPSDETRRRVKALRDEATVSLRNKQPAEAQQRLEQATQADPDDTAAQHDLGLAHLRQQHFSQAADCFRRVLEHDRHHASASANLGAALLQLRRASEAVDRLREAVRLGAASPAVHNNIGAALLRLGDPVGAEAEFHTALRLQPDYPGAHFNLAHALFSQSRFEEAWIEHEWRWRMPGAARRRFKQPKWAGEPLNGRTVLLYCEQSVEDAILFARFAAIAKERGGRVVLECSPTVTTILASCPFVDQVVPAGAELPEFDVQLPLLSIPGLTRVAAHQIPAPVPYLSAAVASVTAMRDRLRSIDGYRVGLARHGMGDPEHDIPGTLLHQLSAIPAVRLIDLEGTSDIQRKTPPVVETIAVLGENDGVPEISETIAAVDIVLTADNLVAHLAGAAGASAWTYLAPSPHWRWTTNGDTTPWYPNMRLLRGRSATSSWETFLSVVRHNASRVGSTAA
jgi:tetratricopeptide (TPR) repeat protein